MDSGTFAGWAWAICGAVCALAIATLVVYSTVRAIRRWNREGK